MPYDWCAGRSSAGFGNWLLFSFWNFDIHNKFDILLYIFRREMSFVASSKKLFCSDSDSLSFSKIHNDEKIIFAIFISDFWFFCTFQTQNSKFWCKINNKICKNDFFVKNYIFFETRFRFYTENFFTISDETHFWRSNRDFNFWISKSKISIFIYNFFEKSTFFENRTPTSRGCSSGASCRIYAKPMPYESIDLELSFDIKSCP